MRCLAASITAAFLLFDTALADPPSPPPSVRLTRDQWVCLQSRLANLRRSSANVVRVPLSPCGQGSGTRGSWVGHVATDRGQSSTRPPPSDTTRAPLYLSKTDLDCIERQLPQLTRTNSVSQVDLTQCRNGQ